MKQLSFSLRSMLDFAIRSCNLLTEAERDKAMVATFYVQPEFPKPDIQRIVNLLIFREETKWQSMDVLLPTVLFHESNHAESYVQIPEWEVIHDRAVGWESSVIVRFGKLVSNAVGKGEQPGHPVPAEVSFFSHGFPHLVTSTGKIFDAQRQTCKVSF